MSDKVFVFAISAAAGADVHARMFSPGDRDSRGPGHRQRRRGAGRLSRRARDRGGEGRLRWSIAQGVEMGRPSRLEVEVEKRDGRITDVAVGGSSVIVSEGTMDVPDPSRPVLAPSAPTGGAARTGAAGRPRGRKRARAAAAAYQCRERERLDGSGPHGGAPRAGMPRGPRRTAASDPSWSWGATAHRANTLTPTPAFTSSSSASVAGT